MGLGEPNGYWRSTHYDVENNLCIDSKGTVDPSCQANGLTGCNGFDPSIVPCADAPCPIAHNVLLTLAQATADGYTTDTGRFVWRPPGGSSPTAGAGANLTSFCSTVPGLCSDTTYANQRVPVARPGTSAWDIGAYNVP